LLTVFILTKVLGLETPERPDRFAGIAGNLPIYLLWVSIGWVIGGFTEEMVFRGFLINRFDRLIHGVKAGGRFSAGMLVAIAAPAFLWGLAHVYTRGLVGSLPVMLAGVAMGILYIAFGRRLIPLIIAHGALDTLITTLKYLQIDN
jgi:membrane protease YdiL (CAAX protease family)